jgi:diguanylate cyclase (GGDEF)-like protein
LTPAHVVSIFVVLGLGAFICHRLRMRRLSEFKTEIEQIEEDQNILKQDISIGQQIAQTLPSRSRKTAFLFELSQKLIELNDTDEIFDFMVSVLGVLFPRADNILLFFVPKGRGELKLCRSLKRKDIAIKEKTGDLIDKWVLRHNQSLAVEDLTTDFRFDSSQLVAFKDRSVRSFVSSPLSVGDNLVGIVRVESKKASSFSLDDSRVLRSICDLGAVVLERASLFRRTEELAIKDSLTTLFVKDHFFQRLNEELKRAHTKNTKVGVIMLDIDDFKAINDNHGHVVGDLVLKKLSQILSRVVGDSGNIAARFGGEEFVLFMVESNKEELKEVAERIRKEAESIVVSFRRKQVNFTVSLGAVIYPDDGMEALDLVEKADKLLYKAKKSGKNKICLA